MSAELAAYGLVCSGVATLADHTLVTDALERARVVGVLDAHCAREGGYWKLECDPDRIGWDYVCLVHTKPGKGLRRFSGSSPDAARAAAAKAIEAGEV